MIGALLSSSTFSRDFKTVEGGALYLERAGVETLRAEFTDASDCELIAKNMREAEPRVRWYCSTSTEPVEFNCTLRNVVIKNTDQNTQTIENFDFKMQINRGIADTNMHAAISRFNAKSSKPYLILKNNYPFIDDNYFSRAITTLRLNSTTGELVSLDINMLQNGVGSCEKTN